MKDKDFEFIKCIECYEQGYGSYTISLYKCRNCVRNDLEENDRNGICHLCDKCRKAEKLESRLGGICIIRNCNISRV